VKLPHEPTVHRMRWVKNTANKYDLVVVPLHGRGNKNGVGDGAKVMAYKMPANPRDAWKTELVNNSMHMTHNFQAVHWSKQPGDEILLGGKEGVSYLVPRSGTWKAMQIIGNAPGQTVNPGAGEVRVGETASKNTFIATIEPMHGNQVAVYTAPSVDATSGLWSRNLLDDSLVDGHALACGDLAGSGSDQIVVGWRAMGKAGTKVGIKLFTPLDKEGKTWKKSFVDDNGMACEDLCLADLNGDGKLDIVAAGRATKNVKIYLNQGVK